MIGRDRTGRRRWTDDTQMSLDLARSLLSRRRLEPEHVAATFAESYRWSRGYGPGTARVLKQIRKGLDWEIASRQSFPGGSFGNGGAMRAPVLALFFYEGASDESSSLDGVARLAASVTHAHPLALDGACLIACATRLALGDQVLSAAGPRLKESCREPLMRAKMDRALELLQQNASPAVVREALGTGMAAAESCPTAFFVAARFQAASFGELLAFCRACGGDVDTISAMAGALWGASNGVERIPDELLREVEAMEEVQALADELFLRTRS